MMNPSNKWYPFFFLMLTGVQPVFAQYQIKHFTTENGLPSNGIKGLQWDDATGFLWIATEAGLVRYNGINFKTFDINTHPDLGSNRIVFVLKNCDGKIFVGGESGNLLTVKENLLKTYLKGETTAKYNYNYYNAISAPDTLFKKCLNHPWSERKFMIHELNLVPINDTSCVVMSGGELYYYSVSTIEPVFLKDAPRNVKIVFTLGKKLYCVDNNRVFYETDISRNIFKIKKVVDEGGGLLAINKKNSNLFWQVGMENAVLMQDQKAWIIEEGFNNQLQLNQIASGIPENTYFNFVQYKKSNGYLFLGSGSKGMYIIRKNQLIVQQPGLNINEKNSFYSQIELADGNIITSEGAILGDLPKKKNRSFSSKFLNSVFSLNDSVVIASFKDSVYRYNKNSDTKFWMFNTTTHAHFAMAYSGSHLYFSNQQGIGTIDNNGHLVFIKNFNSIKQTHLDVVDMTESDPGKLAIATCEGLIEFDIQSKKIDTLLKLPAVCIRGLTKEGDYTFVGTYGGGFYVLKKGVIKSMPLDINRYLKYTHCFIKDRNGFYWISTNNGLFKVKTSDIIDAYEKNLPEIYYHYIGKEDGMQTTEMNGGCTPCAIRLRNNNFSFPTMDGILWLNPEKTVLSTPTGKIFIDKFIVDGRPQTLPANTQALLPVDAKKIEIIVDVNAWCNKENLYVEYKLNDEPWVKVPMATGEGSIGLNNLSYGSYDLLIRKINGFGLNNFTYNRIGFKIATPFYHQWWFRILGLLGMAGIAYLIFRWRIRQYQLKEEKLAALVHEKTMDLQIKNIELEKNDQIKTRLISVINHDIITPLKFMHYAGNTLVEKKDALTQQQQLQTITEITQTAKDMEMLSSQILNWIIYQNPNERMQKEEFDLHQLVEMVFGVLQFPAKLKHTHLHNEVPLNFVVYQYLEPLRVMIYNLMLNSINFTAEGSVKISCTTVGERFYIRVTDTGIGMAKDQIDNILSDEKIIAAANVNNKKGTGLGYMIIKDLLKIMGGQFSINSSKNIGTTVSVSLSLK